ncbi:MAG TPA: hypothetical protein PLM24_05465 [Methanothrix sp.]|nr:hypothetical protein [Methanothrix sp.]HPJ84536.1 hypothetical protein [Methanothrix sp.]HPR66568.1 hypothetical protein [Methanothrix sp.]
MKKFVALVVLAAAFFAVPAMADCDDESMTVTPAGGMTFGKFPMNMNFDFVNQGDQVATARGFGPFNRPTADNAFNLQKDQEAGSLNQMFRAENCTCKEWCKCNVDSRVVNVEMITSGDQRAHAVGNGKAANQVNIMTSQCGNYPKCCCCDSQPCNCMT